MSNETHPVEPTETRDAPACPICGASTQVRAEALPTAVEHRTTPCFTCGVCSTVFVWPLVVPDGLYESVYGHAEQLAGYSRYERYARSSAAAADPLAYLAGQEDVYWAVDQVLRGAAGSSAWAIAEVGSGLGYLTNALRSRGFDCEGIDISETAVEAARSRFGPWYSCEDLFDPAAEHLGAFDLVILLETIEHVPDPIAFLRAVRSLLRPGGRILLTTPNRDAHPSGAIWRTDLPPVHLFWFGEDSVRSISGAIGFDAEFVDFTEFNAHHEQSVALQGLDTVGEPYLDDEMQPIRSIPRRTALMERLRERPAVAAVARAVYDRTRPNREWLVERSFALAAVLTPTDPGESSESPDT